jgi:hypothetical protein
MLPQISLWDEPTLEMDLTVLYVLAEASYLDINGRLKMPEGWFRMRHRRNPSVLDRHYCTEECRDGDAENRETTVRKLLGG